MPIRSRNLMITDLDQSDSNSQHEQQQHDERQQEQQQARHKMPTTRKTQRSGNGREQKVLNTMSGNFNRRSRSMECNVVLAQRNCPPIAVEHCQRRRDGGQQQQQHNENNSNNAAAESRRSKTTGEQRVHEVLQNKESQLAKLMVRVAKLHDYNEQFAAENQQLRKDNEVLELRLTNCESCQKLNTQLATTESSIKTLNNDVDMMKTLVYRLNVQIERYQDELRKHKDIARQNEGGGGRGDGLVATTPPPTPSAYKSSLPEWSANAPPVHTMAPLLKAYDELIADKEDLIQQYNQEFEHFSGELKRTIEENTRLLRENEALKRDIGTWREERTCLQAQLEVFRNKAEAQTRKCDLAKEKLVEVMHCYEQKTQTLMLDMDHLQAAYARCKSELAGLKSASQVSVTQPDIIAASLQECKTLLDALKLEHCKEKQKFEIEIKDLTFKRMECEKICTEMREEQAKLRTQLEERSGAVNELKSRETFLEHSVNRAKRARDRLKARLRMALQWAQKLEAGQVEVQSTYDAVRRLEVVVKHKEAQLRGLHERNIEELQRLQQKLRQRDATIKTLLRNKVGSSVQTPRSNIDSSTPRSDGSPTEQDE